MQFEHMEVGLAGSNRKQVIGPFSSGLNVVSGRRGSGKTRLVGWLRQIIAESGGSPYGLHSVYPYSPYSSLNGNFDSNYYHNHQAVPAASGVLDYRNQGAAARIVQSADGLRSMRGDAKALTNRQREAFCLLAANGDSVGSAAALDDIAVRLGLDDRSEDNTASQRNRLVARERELVASLDRLNGLTATREELLSRRRDVEHRLNQIRQQMGKNGNEIAAEPHFRLDRFAAIDADLTGAVAEIEQCDRQIAEVKADLKLCEIADQKIEVDYSYRQQLQQLEDRLNRWRQTLRDIKHHRESIEHDEAEARLDEQAGMQLSGTLYPDTRGPMRSLEAQLHNARKHLDQLVHQYAITPESNGQVDHGGIQVQRKSDGGARIELESRPLANPTYNYLPEILRSMQKDLHEVCHHLSRYEAQSAARALKQQVEQLRRCERELLQSVEKLFEERGQLLRKIADKYHLTTDQVSLAFGDWCQCNDHEHLAEWLLKDEAMCQATRRSDSHDRTRLTDKLDRLQAQRKEALLRAEECRRQLRDLERGRPTNIVREVNPSLQAEESELLNELQANSRTLADLDARDQLRAELEDIRYQIAKLPSTPMASSQYRELVNRHIVGLSNSLVHSARTTPQDYSTSRQYDTVNGVVTELPTYRRQVDVPQSLVSTAQRLAIAQMLASRGEPIPVVLDQTLDALPPAAMRNAVDYLAQMSQQFQIIVLTDNWALVDLAKQRRGRLLTLESFSRDSVPNEDVNRILTSLANEQEADQWYRPAVEAPIERTKIRQYYLSRYSRIEELPVIPQSVAARCRMIGIDSVGDLLDANPLQLVHDLGIQSISESTIRNWQAIAVLLCSVRGLRPFDARVLVGAGIRNAQQLSSIQPTQLLERVERFLATDIGRKILRSGNSYELSRITSWIASAKSGSVRATRTIVRDPAIDDTYDELYDTDGIVRADASHSASRQMHHTTSSSRAQRRRRRSISRQDSLGLTERGRNRDRLYKDQVTADRRTQSGSLRSLQDNSAETHSERHSGTVGSVSNNGRRDSQGSSSSVKYYLELSSPVVDAPSIGQNTGEKLNQAGIYTVEQLLAASAESLARKLNHRRITAEVVRDWQDQARLVCRIPYLRGHDAQMLVACKITTPESLANMRAETVLEQVQNFARTQLGQRILRGGNEPDLAEVRNWISWANQCRSLNAA